MRLLVGDAVVGGAGEGRRFQDRPSWGDGNRSGSRSELFPQIKRRFSRDDRKVEADLLEFREPAIDRERDNPCRHTPPESPLVHFLEHLVGNCCTNFALHRINFLSFATPANLSASRARSNSVSPPNRERAYLRTGSPIESGMTDKDVSLLDEPIVKTIEAILS